VYIELIDLLRCPRPHEESWLVAAFDRMEGRFVIEGKLGCPVCSATYLIRDGVADLRDDPSAFPASADSNQDTGEDAEETSMRVAAMLGLTRPGAVAVLDGMDAALAGIIAGMTNARVVALNSSGSAAEESEGVAAVLSGDLLPFAASSVDGIMLGGALSPRRVQEALRVLKQGGRLVAPADADLSGGLRQLARDDRYVVAESTGPLITLSR
jgi:uncharacterized protein YbaR (Trm112 family)